MIPQKTTQSFRKPMFLLGNKISEIIKQTKKFSYIVYKFKKEKCYVFSHLPFRAIYVENNIACGVDKRNNLRQKTCHSGLVLAAPEGNTEFTLVGDIINLSKSAVCIRPYRKQLLPDCIWKIHIDLGNTAYDTFGNIFKKDNNTVIFKFTEKFVKVI